MAERAPGRRAGSAVAAAPTGGTDGGTTPASIVVQGPVAAKESGDAAAGTWPVWARPQLLGAVQLAEAAPDHLGIARLLYREWFSPEVPDASGLDDAPLVGTYRAAHAGSRRRIRAGGVRVVDRADLLGPDGWWRTWGRSWAPPRSRRGSIRLTLTPRADRVSELVATVTGMLLTSQMPWSLGCAVRPRRLARLGAAVLDLPGLEAAPAGLLEALEPLLQPSAPPLCRPVRPGIGLTEYPDNGMTFGEHRCHLVALALRHPSSAGNPLRTIASVFAAHDIDPTRPYANG